MIAIERTAAILLCGGHSRRFGPTDKLLHPLVGKPLVAHIAQTLAMLPLLARFATVRPGAPDLEALLAEHGFATIAIDEDADQRQSLQCGLDAALSKRPDAFLLALGDMPFVTGDHIRAIAKAADDRVPAASKGDGWLGPPWIAASHWVEKNRGELKAALHREAIAIAPPDAILSDIDRIEDLPPILT